MKLLEEMALKLEKNTAFKNAAMMARRVVVGT